MRPKRAEFIKSATAPAGFPPPELPEIAFAGRSNVGKSSLINTLVGVQGLAKTSNTPGRTRLLNWFRVEPAKGAPIAFVDLPGYGYAKVPRGMRDAWRPMVEGYLGRRDVLKLVIVLVDARRGAQSDDVELLEWLDEAGLRAVVVLTKSDKLAKSKRKPLAFSVKKELGLRRTPICSSASSGDGMTDVWREVLAACRAKD